MVENIRQLKEITAVLLSSVMDYSAVRNASLAMMELFCNATDLDKLAAINEEHIKTASGVAVSTISAVNCIMDMNRNRIFLMGLQDAIEEKLKTNPYEPVIVLYAGTGPFATLVSPLTTVFSPAQLQLVLLEINPLSIGYLNKTIQQFGMEPFVMSVIETDAASFIIPDKYQPDIIVSETMMPTLRTEPMVAIIANLVSQCTRNLILIPESVLVEVALITNIIKPGYKIFPLKQLLELNAQTAVSIKTNITSLPVFSDGITVTVDEMPDPSFTSLSLLTTIQVFKTHILDFNKCSLTMPQPVINLKDINKWPATFRFQYAMGVMPGFVVSRE